MPRGRGGLLRPPGHCWQRVHDRSWPSDAELRTEVVKDIEVFFNRRRRHSTLGMLSPADYENRTLEHRGTSLAASRLTSTHKIKFTAPTRSASRLTT